MKRLKAALLIALVFAGKAAFAEPTIEASLLVNAINIAKPDAPRFLTFTVIAGDYLGDSTLKVALDLPHGHELPAAPVFKLKRKKVRPDGQTYFDWVELLAENYLTQDGDTLSLYLPLMGDFEVAEFQIGWVGATPHHYAATLTLTSTQGPEQVKQWRGDRHIADSDLLHILNVFLPSSPSRSCLTG